MTPEPYASLGMYPFDHLVSAWEQLWATVHHHAPWTPPQLRWSGDVQADWRAPACVVTHACGWPVAAQLAGVVEVVGAFSLRMAEARGHEYRSVVVSPDPEVLARVGPDTTVRAAANSEDSLSGWVSLLAAVGRPAWPGPVTWTGAHYHSLVALNQGRADVACIDGLTLDHLRRRHPHLVGRLHTVALGPWIPSPAVVVRPDVAAHQRAQLVAGLQAATADPEIGSVLGYNDFVLLDAATYEPTLHLVPKVVPSVGRSGAGPATPQPG